MAYSRDYPNSIIPKGSKVVECLQNDDKELKRILGILSDIGVMSLFGSKRQCVLHAATGTYGKPSYITANGLKVVIDGSTTPVIVTFAGGYDANGTVDKTGTIVDTVNAWTMPANGTYYLYIDKDMSTGILSYGYTTIPDTYATTAPASPVLDQCYFNTVDMKMYHYNSSAWEQKLRVFVAKAVTTADTATLTIYPFTSRTTASNFIQYDGNGNLQAVDLAGALTQFSASKFIGTFKGDIVGNADTATKALAADKCTGNADTATKATQDKNGADIVNTYFPKSGGTITGDLTVKGNINGKFAGTPTAPDVTDSSSDKQIANLKYVKDSIAKLVDDYSPTILDTLKELAESTGYGIVSGCTPSINGLTVTVASGVVHLANGTRKELSASAVTLDAADNMNPRIDLVYITSAGAVGKITGMAAASPSAPALPTGGISVAQVSVAANATTGAVTDKRDMLPRWYNAGVVNVKDYGAKGDGVTDDTLAIQSVIDNNKGKIIQFPYGTYLISAPIYTYRGDTKRSLLLLNKAVIKASPNFPAISFMITIGDESTGDINNYWDSHSMCGLIGGIIDGNNVAYGGVKYLESSLGKLMDFSVVGVTDIGVQVGLPNFHGWSTDTYISRLSIGGTFKENSVGLLIYSCDNNIEYVRTANYPIGIQVVGGGNYIRECHPLYFEPVRDSEVGFDIQGSDTNLVDCYSDGFKTCIKTNGAFPLTVNGFFGYYPDSITKNCAFVENTQDYCSFIIRNARVLFSSKSSSNIGYKVNTYTRTYDALGDYGFFDVVFTNITNPDSDYAIVSPLAHNTKRSLDDNFDLDKICATGIYALQRLSPSNDATKNRPSTGVTSEYYGILEVNSSAGVYCNRFDAVVQTFYVALSTNKYKRIFFGVYDANVEGGGWTSWTAF